MRTTVSFRVAIASLIGALFVALLPAWAKDSPTKSVAAALQPFVDNHSLAGAVVLVANKDKVLTVEAVGYADIGAKTPMKKDTLFWIASQSKPITAVALMMLVDEGKVKLDDPVEKYLPEFKEQIVAVDKQRRKPKHPITVRNVLSHTSGLPGTSELEKPTLDVFTLKERAASYAKTPLLFDPDSKYQYSNAGINTAGRIIEVVSGMPYEDFLDKRLLGPLGMKDTTFWPNEEQAKRLAKSYKANKAKNDLEETTISQLHYPLTDRKRQPMPAGGLFSTASDLAQFCQMMLNGGVFEGKRYLSEAAVKEMTTKQTGKDIKQSYGLGWSTGGGTFGHGGAYKTNMTVDPAKGLITVYMVQYADKADEVGKSREAFRKAAEELYGGAKK